MSAEDPHGLGILNYELQKANLIWDEYKYRHEHIWKLIFQFTTAVIAVSIVPYILKDDVAKKFDGFISLLPFIGSALASISSYRLWQECLILDKIRPKHRAFHKLVFKIDYRKKDHKKENETSDYNTGKFTRDVVLYLVSLVVLSIFNGIVVLTRL